MSTNKKFPSKNDIRALAKQQRLVCKNDLSIGEKNQIIENIKTFINDIDFDIDKENQPNKSCNFPDDGSKTNIFGLYHAINDEINIISLFSFLNDKNYEYGLPVVANKIMNFKSFKNGDGLEKGPFDILQPKENNPDIIPNIIFCPLLAYDKNGNRIGYGGGFYDKYCAKFKPMMIGISYDALQIEKLVGNTFTGEIFNQFDYKLDYLITEKNIIKFD